MRSRNLGWIALLALLLAASAGCGGSSKKSNGVASKPADAIVAAALAATNSAKSVHVSGTIPENGRQLTLDLHIAGSRGGSGWMAEKGARADIVRIGPKAYMKGSAAFWISFGGKAAAQILAGRWIVGSATSGNFASLTPLTDLHKLVGGMLSSHGKLVKGATTTIAGRSVIAVTDTTTQGGTLYIATTGQPYPVELVETGASAGKLTFDQWNAAVTLTAPKGAVDFSKLTH
jgi:hypothetical protein